MVWGINLDGVSPHVSDMPEMALNYSAFVIELYWSMVREATMGIVYNHSSLLILTVNSNVTTMTQAYLDNLPAVIKDRPYLSKLPLLSMSYTHLGIQTSKLCTITTFWLPNYKVHISLPFSLAKSDNFTWFWQ